MPKRKWNRLHDDATIADERRHRAQKLSEQRDARATIDAELQEPPHPPEPILIIDKPGEPDPKDR